MRRILAVEAAMWRNLFAWVLRKPVDLGAGEKAYSYHGVVKPILGVFIGLSVVEIPIFDLIVRKVVPWEPARWIVLVLGVWGLLWMIGFAAGLKRHPHVVGEDGIRVRLGNGVDFTVPWADVESVGRRYRSLPSNKSVQVEDGALHVVMGGQTSVDIRLRRPAGEVTGIERAGEAAEVRIYVDEPDDFVRAARAGQPEPA
ncbi:PH domain-containing protein [Actinoplanes sp. CA-054009]